MSFSLSGKLVVAISSRALFDFEEENRVFEATNDSAYMQVQQERLAIPAKEGVAFPLVEKLLKFNTATESRVEVVILSRNDPVSGLRVFRSAEHAGLKLERGVFTRGRPPYHYLRSLHANLFLSANEQDVRETILAGFPAALVYPQSVKIAKSNPNEVRIAFDGDAVLFSDESEQIFQTKGLDAFVKHETHLAKTPLPPGPFKPLLEALQQLQNSSQHASMKIRTALVTARSAPTHERAIRTLMSWGIDVDEAMFLGGLNKSDFLREFAPDFFFDDQTGHCEMASEVAPTGQVISGITNQRKE
jgi:5'-nucleotidase